MVSNNLLMLREELRSFVPECENRGTTINVLTAACSMPDVPAYAVQSIFSRHDFLNIDASEEEFKRILEWLVEQNLLVRSVRNGNSYLPSEEVEPIVKEFNFNH